MHKSVRLVTHLGYCRKNCRINSCVCGTPGVRLEVYWAIVTYIVNSLYGMCNMVHLSVRLEMYLGYCKSYISEQ